MDRLALGPARSFIPARQLRLTAQQSSRSSFHGHRSHCRLFCHPCNLIDKGDKSYKGDKGGSTDGTDGTDSTQSGQGVQITESRSQSPDPCARTSVPFQQGATKSMYFQGEEKLCREIRLQLFAANPKQASQHLLPTFSRFLLISPGNHPPIFKVVRETCHPAAEVRGKLPSCSRTCMTSPAR